MAAIRTLLRDFHVENDVYAGAAVAAYVADSSGVASSTLATLYAAESGLTQVENPVRLDGRGRVPQPVYFNQAIVLRVNAAFSPSHDTGVIRPSLDDAAVAAAAASAAAASASAVSAATSAQLAAQSAAASSNNWPRYWRHEVLSQNAY